MGARRPEGHGIARFIDGRLPSPALELAPHPFRAPPLEAGGRGNAAHFDLLLAQPWLPARERGASGAHRLVFRQLSDLIGDLLGREGQRQRHVTSITGGWTSRAGSGNSLLSLGYATPRRL